MKTYSYHCIGALILTLLSHASLAGDAEITLKASQEIKYGPVITIKPKGITSTHQPVRKIEPEEIDRK